MSTQVGFLAHYQSTDCKPSTSVPKAIAELLVSRLAAERVSRKLIRAFPPGTAFTRLIQPSSNYIPEVMPRSEVIGNVKFQLPQSDEWKRTHLPSRRYLSEMAYLMARSMPREAHTR